MILHRKTFRWEVLRSVRRPTVTVDFDGARCVASKIAINSPSDK